MKLKMLSILITLQLLLLSNVAFAYKQADVETLRRTNRCTNCDLSKVNLEGANLKGAVLDGSTLKYAKFKKAYLVGASFNGANLKGTNFEGALWIDGVTVCKKGSIGKCLAEIPVE